MLNLTVAATAVNTTTLEGVTVTAATPGAVSQPDNFYLSSHQGGVAGGNGARAAWVNRIDLSLKQEIPGFFVGNKDEIRFDFDNVLNMLNKRWGDIYDVDFLYMRMLASVAGVDPATGKQVRIHVADLGRKLRAELA